MEVILLQDVKNVGKADDIVTLSDGYARNVIIKKGLGVEKTPKALQDLKYKKKVEAEKAAELLAEAKDMAAKLAAITVKCKIKIGENGRVFGAVSAKEVAEALKAQAGLEVDKKKLVMQPFKNMGNFTAGVKLHPEVTAELKVVVEEE